MEKQYNPVSVEERIYTEWLSKGFFHASVDSGKKPYSIVIPPPNVTGILHMGHALNNTIQDILIRYQRMNGKETLWMPGTDHAGIATQNVVEKKLAKEGKKRNDLGREAFIQEVWRWKEQYHAVIVRQLKKLGVSCDWDRERFTMDEGLSRAVRKVFVSLYRDGLIYKGKYIINWCPRCQTALSDEEAEHVSLNSKLYYFRYPYSDGSGYLLIATTRPETMLGDVAVAVHPSDERYKEQIGKDLSLPLTQRKIPVIADHFVSREFGTGAVKVTPAHDPNDFAIAQRHNLTPLQVIDESGLMCGPVPEKYRGMDRFACRKEIISDLEKNGLVEKIDNYTHSVGHCYRCHTVVEPFYSDQWFVRMKPLAEKPLQAAKNEEVRFYPPRYTKIFMDWLENIRDWCISRQIWWGHRIPVWYCLECKEVIVEEEQPKSCLKCGSTKMEQDKDVLDTWFSSWLWPFSTMGWPENTETLQKFYPTNTLVSGPDIIFFWIARMIMAGFYCTNKLPFTDVVLTSMVRDKTGKKMSKSAGNVIDPLEIVAEYGTDALRFSLIMITAQGADSYIEKDTFEIGRNFANKLWNASRFLLSNLSGNPSFSTEIDYQKAKPEDRWILSKLHRTISEIHGAMNGYRLNEICHSLYDFIWHDFCDWYIEAKKADLYQTQDNDLRMRTLQICTYLLASILKLLHPIMPFITEEIWQCLKKEVSYPGLLQQEYIMMANFPVSEKRYLDTEVESRFSLLKEIVVAIRTIKSENNVPPDKRGSTVIIPLDLETDQWLNQQIPLFRLLGRVDGVTIGCSSPKPNFAGNMVIRGVQVFVELEGLIDKALEIGRLQKEIERFRLLVTQTTERLQNDSFVGKAPAAIVAKEKEKLQGMLLTLEKLEKNLSSLIS